jgi:hypothetical protein
MSVVAGSSSLYVKPPSTARTWLWHRALLGRLASESGTLRHGDGAKEIATIRRAGGRPCPSV